MATIGVQSTRRSVTLDVTPAEAADLADALSVTSNPPAVVAQAYGAFKAVADRREHGGH